MADAIYAERGAKCGVEREHRRLVRMPHFILNYNSVSFSAVQPLSSITASLYAKYALHKDILIGRKEIHCEPQHGSSFSECPYAYH
jgi:hypothetical protein